ncbi:EAL domain-containing protein [Vibrio albus]|uniref:EAL domain-containing protein n=1 Tax=Vibrio albus TaxID=2200953 RepID=A0A2U3B870_9VIBR|nr:EAL domain-containing protein [Vibrio albus]PWI32972.1 EAL domain-containing protein [Vibrio albus]
MQNVIHSRNIEPLSQQGFIAQSQLFYDSIRYNNIGLVLAIRPAINDSQRIISFIDTMSRSKSVKTFGKVNDHLFLVFISQATCDTPNRVRAIHYSIYNFFSELKSLSQSSHQFAISGKIGVSALNYDSSSIKGAVTHASQATMEQDTNSKQRVSIYDSKLSSDLKRYRLLEDLVSIKINNDELDIVYQPIINCSTWQVDGYEALCRFNVSEVLNADTKEMIGIAEDLDMVSELDLLVYQRAFKELSTRLNKKGQFININLSPNTRTNVDNLFRYIEVLADQESISLEQLVIDVNEVRRPSLGLTYENLLPKVRQKGIRVALDDLSMGFSLAPHLSSGNYNYLRVSHKFIRNFNEQSEYYQIVKFLVTLSHKFRVKVIAEGIETLEEAQLLAYLGVDFMQGYLFSPPVPQPKLHEVEKEIQSLLKQLHVKGLSAGSSPDIEEDASVVISIASKNLPRLDPGDSLLLASEYFSSEAISVLPVLDDKQCVGIVNRELLNLHFTPGMGTEHESTREAAIWQKPVNSLMNVTFPQMEAQTKISDLIYLIKEQGFRLPVVLVEDKKVYRGMVTESDLTHYVIKKNAKLTDSRLLAQETAPTKSEEDGYPVI